MQAHLTEAYARSRVRATTAEAARRRVDDVWAPKGSHPPATEWDRTPPRRRLVDRISYSENHRPLAGGAH